MKNLFLLAMVLPIFTGVAAQSTVEKKLYDPAANAETQIAVVVEAAAQHGKFVLIVAGGNWCSWCIEFNRFCHENHSIDSLLEHSFVEYHLNYSKENKNLPVFRNYGFPQRFGFPVFIILDGKGNRIHTQNSSYLEKGESYDDKKVLEFLSDWSPDALDPSKYK